MDVGYESDSDFYGQSETVTRLKERVRLAEDEAPLAVARRRGVNGGAVIRVGPRPAGHQLHNPYAGIAYAWQLEESIDDFICRLPPATTTMDRHTPWIYVCNPFVEGRKKARSGSRLVPGCEDEGPEAEGSHTVLFVEGARERLDLLGTFLGGIARMSLPRGAALREAANARQAAVGDVLGLAKHLGVTSGKWMLFVHPDRVNKAWETVARATCRGELGIAAKVAPRDPTVDHRGERRRQHLICVFTSDFRDADDVGRVLRRLESLRLVRRHRGGSVYYKCDAYTYLGIGAENPWGLRASLFSSDDVFARLGSEG